MSVRSVGLLSLLVGASIAAPNLRTQGDIGDTAPIVSDPELGKIKGLHMDTLFGKPFSAFKGIPYVVKPTRFQYAAKWTGKLPLATGAAEYDATYFRDRCAQTSYLSALKVQYSGSEDCLHLSVYTPLTDTTNAASSYKGRPVFVFIHGGSYNSGEASLYQPTRLMQQDMVVVIVQYRLGILGFLYANSTLAPGNQGLHDMYQSLEWVQAHIRSFGGDPGLVTLAGQSAGAASVSLLMTSPLLVEAEQRGRPLAHRFMPMSGSGLEYWTLGHHAWGDDLRYLASLTYNSFTGGNCDHTEATAAVKCLLTASVEEIVQGSSSAYTNDRLLGNLGFRGQTPRIQDPNGGYDTVLVEYPLTAYKNKNFTKKPVLAGSVRDEGSLAVGLMYRDYLIPNNKWNNTDYIRENLTTTVSNSFGYHDNTEALSNSFRLAFMPHDMHLGNFSKMASGLVDLTSVLFLKSGSYKSMNTMLDNHPSLPVYYYSFEFESNDSLFPWLLLSSEKIPVPKGVCHTDDLLYMFALPSHFDERQKKMSLKMTTLYWNFAKHGDPTPDVETNWLPMAEKWNKLSRESLAFQLLSDQITSEEDIVVRWNHHIYDKKTAQKD